MIPNTTYCEQFPPTQPAQLSPPAPNTSVASVPAARHQRVALPPAHRYPLRSQQQINSVDAHVNELPPWLIPAILDNTNGILNIDALRHDAITSNQLNAVTDPITGKSQEYRHLINDPDTRKVWDPAMARKVDNLVDTQTIKFIPKASIPKTRKTAYIRIVIDIHPNKAIHKRVRLTIGGDQIDYPGEVTTQTVDLTTTKIHLNSVVSTPNSIFAVLDIGSFYLDTPLE